MSFTTLTNFDVLDDNVALVRVQKVYYDKNNPRIELTIKPVDYIGIFNNVSHLENFKNKCICCKRYRNGKCSILIKAIEGRIQQEIEDDICLKFENKKGEI